MRYNEFIRRKIQQTLDREAVILQLCVKHGDQYAEVLGVSESDLEVLWRIGGESEELVVVRPLAGLADHTEIDDGEREVVAGFDDSFLKLEIDGKKFYFIVRPVSEPPDYSDEPKKIIMVFSSDDDLNVFVENETVFLTAVLEEWHEKILNLLQGGKIDIMSDDSE